MPSSRALVAASPSSDPSSSRLLQRAPLLAQVTGPVRGHPVGELGGRLLQPAAGLRRHRLGPAPRPDERQRPHAVGDGVGEEVGRLHQGRSADRYGVTGLGAGQQGWFPEAEGHARLRRGVLRHGRHRQPGQAGGRHPGVPGRRRGKEEDRTRRGVPRGHAPQTPDHLGDVRAEHAPVHMGLIDDHKGQSAQERRPLLVPRQDRPVQHVRVAVDETGVGADPFAFGGGRVPVVGARMDPLERQSGRRAQLVGRQRLGRREVERGGPGMLEQVGQDGQLVGQGLAGGRRGAHHDVLAGAGAVGDLDLVPPRLADAAARQCRPQRLRYPVRPGDGAPDRPGTRCTCSSGAVRPRRSRCSSSAGPNGRGTPENSGTFAARASRRAG
jgi:hypothetical protein